MKTHKLSQSLLAATLLSFGSVYADTQVAQDRALEMLHMQDVQLENKSSKSAKMSIQPSAPTANAGA